MILWEARFYRISHDQLGNYWAFHISRVRRYLSKELQFPDEELDNVVSSFSNLLTAEWSHLCDEILVLMNDLEGEMTPVRVFENNQAQHGSRYTQDWMETIVHNLWLTRCQIRPSIKAVIKRTSATRRAVKNFDLDMKAFCAEDAGDVECARDGLEDFMRDFFALTDAISSLHRKFKRSGVPRYC